MVYRKLNFHKFISSCSSDFGKKTSDIFGLTVKLSGEKIFYKFAAHTNRNGTQAFFPD